LEIAMAEAQENQATHQPYVGADVTIPEFTWSAVLVGTGLGILFGASSLYLVLKVGMTVSASIPVAVMSITLFRACSRIFGFRRTTILENNIVQTTGSAGESIAFGVGVTMPALMLLGFQMEISRVMVVSVLGGVLGILMMIPLRRAFIVKRHGERRRANRRGARRSQRQDRVHRLRDRLPVRVPAAGSAAVEGGSRPRPVVVQGSRAVDGSQPDAAGRRLHHRHARVLDHVGRGPAGVLRLRARDPLFRRRPESN
jgi:hypothetical protein